MESVIGSSGEDEMQDVDSLTKVVNSLNDNVDFWNFWMQIGLVAAAIAALWLAVTTRLVIVKSKALTVAQANLDAGKEAVLKLALANSEQVTEKLRQENLNLQADVLKLRARTEYRHLSLDQRHAVANKLRRFAGIEFALVVYNSESDGSAIKDDIMNTLTGSDGSGWVNHSQMGISASAPETGIVIETNTTAKNPETKQAANALAEALRNERIFVPPVRTAESRVYLAVGGMNPGPGSTWDIRISIERRP